MPKRKKRSKPWSYSDAQKAIPSVRRHLRALRKHYIACWHYVRLNGHDPTCHEYHPKWLHHRQKAEAALNKLFDLGVCVFLPPFRGIALFRFVVEVELDEDSTAVWIAFWLYRDSRDEIESFVFARALHPH